MKRPQDHLHHRRAARSQARRRPDHPRGGRGGRRLHPAALLDEGARPRPAACRVCTVRVNGRPQSACTQPVAPGMIVENDTEELRELRRDLIDMLFVEGNHFCMFCEKSGNCELQALAYRFGITAPKYPFLFPRPRARRHATRTSSSTATAASSAAAACGPRASSTASTSSASSAAARDKRIAVNAEARPRRHRRRRRPTRRSTPVPIGSLLRKRVGFAVPVGQRAVRPRADRLRHRAAADRRVRARPWRNRKSRRPRCAAASAATCRCSTSTSGSWSWSSWSTSTARRSTTSRRSTGRCDVGLIEGGCANEENVKVLREFRQHCKVLISVGDCAINGGIPALRNTVPLEECYARGLPRRPVGGQPERQDPRRPGDPAAARQGLPLPRGGQDRLPPARLPAVGRHAVGGADRAARPASRSSCPTSSSSTTEPEEMPCRSPSQDASSSSPVTRVEGHGKVTILLDDDNRVAAGAAAHRRVPRLRALHPGPPVLGAAGAGAAAVRHLPGEPPPVRRQGGRRHRRRRAADADRPRRCAG